MVENRSRVWKVMTSLMMNFDLQVRLLTCMGDYETFLVYLVILLLTNANDIHLNPGPRTEREYLCGTCDKTVNWEERGVIRL
jgi:hypothetical protein